MNESRTEFNVNGVTLAVTMNVEDMRKVLQQAVDSWELNHFTEAWTVEEGQVSKENYMGDIERAKEYLDVVESDPTILEEYVQRVRKKKNGEFWSRSGVTIQYLNNVSEYHTDFTNSWNILQLRLKVVNAKTCELDLVYKFETN